MGQDGHILISSSMTGSSVTRLALVCLAGGLSLSTPWLAHGVPRVGCICSLPLLRTMLINNLMINCSFEWWGPRMRTVSPERSMGSKMDAEAVS